MAHESDSTDLTATERSAMHEVEVGVEWMLRAQGHLLAFHHAIGHGMDHLDAAETPLRDAGYPALADHIRDELLPRGVTADDRWTYSVVEEFQRSFLPSLTEFEREACEALTDGRRHVAERAQEQAWRERASR